MDENDAPVTVPGRLPQIILGMVVLLFFLAAQLLSDRPQLPLKRPWIDFVADLPASADQEKFANFIYATTGRFSTGRRPTLQSLYQKRPALADNDQPKVQLGYSIHEYVALAMPFFATKQVGYVLYIDSGSNMYLAPLDDDGLKLFQQQVGAPVGEGYSLHWWSHMWGLIPLGCLIALIVLEIRRARRKRLASGIL